MRRQPQLDIPSQSGAAADPRQGGAGGGAGDGAHQDTGHRQHEEENVE